MIVLVFLPNQSFALWKSWNKNNVACHTTNNNSGQKAISSSISNNKPSSWSFRCEYHGYYSWDWYWPYNKWYNFNCPDKRFASKIINLWSQYKVYCKRRDDDPPSIKASSLWWNVLAIDKFNVAINYWINQSWVWVFKAKIENFDNKNKMDNINLSGKSFNINIKKVDNDRTSWSYREYSLELNKVCDEAENCIAWLPKTYKYNVYSNSNKLGKLEFNSAIDFTSWKSANWIVHELKAIIKDIYWNQIIPAIAIKRTIDFKFDVENKLRRNQYSNIWDWIYLSTPNDKNYTNKLTKNNNFDSLKSSNGEYPFNFKIYSPTIHWNKFTINNVKVDINWNIWNRQNLVLWWSNIKFNFKPLYNLNFSWNQDKWLVEWANQSGSINVTKYWSDNLVSKATKYIYLQKYWEKKDEFDWKARINPVEKSILNSLNSFVNGFVNSTNYKIKSLFTLKSWSKWFIDDIKNVYLRSWIWYKIEWKSVLYRSSSIWETNTQNNFGIKVYWNTNIDKSKQRDLNNEQDNKDVKNIAWEITKSSLKKDIRKNAIEKIKNIKTDKDWIDLMNWRIKFYDYRNHTKKIKNFYWDLWDNKTIVILWANAYVKWNLNLWWLIVLKDDKWNGWNLYIDPNVEKIKSIIYTDKSAISYNSNWWEISPNNGWDYDRLKKQLYINGSLFSENTIWGSRLETPKCPFYLWYSNNSCSLDEAQKYDLNYLRRWIEWWDVQIDSKTGKKYPVVIKYNPNIQISPPALFSK